MDYKEDLVGKGRKIKNSRSVILLNSLHKYVPVLLTSWKAQVLWERQEAPKIWGKKLLKKKTRRSSFYKILQK